MNARGDRSRRRARGQTTVLGLVLILVSAATVVLLYNTGQTASEKARLVNAADAAAYSGAIYVARNLNFMAYTNRAMIANHVAVGHFISYVSWIRYVDQAADRLNKLGKIAKFIPWIGPFISAATRIIHRVGRVLKKVTKAIASPYVKASELLNGTLFGAQLAASAGMKVTTRIGPLFKVMDQAAKEYAHTIKVNDPGDLRSSTGAVAAGQIAKETSALFRFARYYNASNDSGRLKKMVLATVGASTSASWIEGNRGWTLHFWPEEFKKQGSTGLIMSRRLSDWRAHDELSHSWWTIKGWKRSTLARGSASAREFYRGYRGVRGYYDLASPGDRKDHVLNITAYATMPMSEARIRSLLGMVTSTRKLAAISRAEVYHKRPKTGFAALGKGEYSNLYNPFWEARLVKPPY